MPRQNHPSDLPSRRQFLAGAGLAAAALLTQTRGRAADAPPPSGETPARPAGRRPIGLELYSVRTELARDLPATLRELADIGYEDVEFYAPYFEWTIPRAKEVRTMLDDLGLRCLSTHNSLASFAPGEGLAKATELNQILGTRYLILAHPGHELTTVAACETLCTQLRAAVTTLAPHGLRAGFHNHQTEWAKVDGERRAMDVIAANTPPEFALQLDVGTCVEAGADPVAWIKSQPGRIRSVHLKDWAPGRAAEEKSYRVLFGEGVAPWAEIIAAAEATGGVEFFLLEQEGSRYSEFETARRSLARWKKFRAGA
ncbi:MAG TPA: sugar phosphate isomerase/epimerase [Opitutus sp.]|nr:sugar phosphate isomerase/epimerase [Opitutus sp.]